jgi:isopenicillin N synthase-like dioxygenase
LSTASQARRTSFDAIPVVDIATLSMPETAAARATADALCRAYERVGFAGITGHGVPQDLIDRCFAASRAFHAAPIERKQSIAINAFHRGYMGIATSTVVTSTVARNTKPNLSESLLVMHELAPDDPDLVAGRPLQGPNRWPDWQPEFKPTILAYMAALEAVARRLLDAFTLGMGLPRALLAPLFRRPTVFLRLLHYPPHPADAPEGQFGSAPHTDYGCMTILAQDASGGLQVQAPDGNWVDAPPMPGAFVLNLGDLMPRWSNGRFRSTPHRVINNRSGGDRYSLPYFFDPGMDARIECLPGCAGPDNPPRFPPMRYGDYLMERLDKNYDYRKTGT